MVGANAESGIVRIGKINVEKPGVHLGQGHAAAGRSVDGQHHFISTRGVAGLGNGDALKERTGAGKTRESEIAYDPLVGLMIIENKWVASVLAAARCAH